MLYTYVHLTCEETEITIESENDKSWNFEMHCACEESQDKGICTFCNQIQRRQAKGKLR